MELDLTKTACFTGHRPQHFSSKTDIEASKIALKRTIARAKELGYTHFISGMALGVDQWAAIAVLDDPELRLIAAVPCRDQQKPWRWTDQLMYQQILNNAHRVVFIHDGSYYDGCMDARNRWMCDRSSLVLAVWDGKGGGTANCVNYARSLDREGMIFNPKIATYRKLNK